MNGSPSINMRSAKVPLSPSSALQTMYFVVPAASSTVRHLMPVGKAAPPRPRRPLSVTSVTTSAGCICQRPTQPDEPTIGYVVVGRARVDDTDALERDALLAGHPRQLIGEAQPQRVVAPGEQAGVDKTRHVVADRTGP